MSGVTLGRHQLHTSKVGTMEATSRLGKKYCKTSFHAVALRYFKSINSRKTKYFSALFNGPYYTISAANLLGA